MNASRRLLKLRTEPVVNLAASHLLQSAAFDGVGRLGGGLELHAAEELLEGEVATVPILVCLGELVVVDVVHGKVTTVVALVLLVMERLRRICPVH